MGSPQKIESWEVSRVCTLCNNEKPIDLFKGNTNLRRCRDCMNKQRCEYRLKNKDKINQRQNERRIGNSEKLNIKLRAKRLNADFRAKNIEYQKQRRLKNIDEFNEKARNRHRCNRDVINEKNRKKYAENAEQYRLKKLEYRLKNKAKIAACAKRSYIKQMNTPILKFKVRTRSLIYKAINRCGYSKDSYTKSLLGINFDGLKIYIERQFKSGMAWENHGEWHIDHIMPIASAKNKEELMKLFHYTNLRPLWAKENRIKGSKIIEHQLKMVI
jgi:hypothetical protein